jgi:hypothetical protein
VAYDFVYAAWQGDVGGRDPETAYGRYVERGLTAPPENPFRNATQGWLLGNLKFVDRALSDTRKLRRDIAAIRRELLNTERI